jgi:2-hydroxychromene-2-carboxylate isomerase
MTTPPSVRSGGPRILVTGCEKSGTGVVAQVLREAGAHVIHKAMPHVHDWDAALNVEARYAVVVVRGLRGHVASLLEHSGELPAANERAALFHREKALRRLASLALPSIWVTYESLSEPAEVVALCAALGLDASEVETLIENRNLARYDLSDEGAQ